MSLGDVSLLVWPTLSKLSIEVTDVQQKTDS